MAVDLDKPFTEMSDDDRIEFAMRARHDLILYFTHNTDGSPVGMMGDKEAAIVRGTLKDMDSSIYTKRRLATDEISAEADKFIAESAERILAMLPRDRRDPDGPVKARTVDVDKSELPTFTFTEGETSAVGNDVDLDEIIAAGRKKFKGI